MQCFLSNVLVELADTWKFENSKFLFQNPYQQLGYVQLTFESTSSFYSELQIVSKKIKISFQSHLSLSFVILFPDWVTVHIQWSFSRIRIQDNWRLSSTTCTQGRCPSNMRFVCLFLRLYFFVYFFPSKYKIDLKLFMNIISHSHFLLIFSFLPIFTTLISFGHTLFLSSTSFD